MFSINAMVSNEIGYTMGKKCFLGIGYIDFEQSQWIVLGYANFWVEGKGM